ASSHYRPNADRCTSSLKGGHGASRVKVPKPSKRQQVPLGIESTKLVGVPAKVIGQRHGEGGIQRDCPAFPGFSFALPDHEGQVLFVEMNVAKLEIADFSITKSCV